MDEEASCNRVNWTKAVGLTNQRRVLFKIIVQRLEEENGKLLQLEPGD